MHSIQIIVSNYPVKALHHHMKIIGLEQLKDVNHLMFVEQIKYLIKPYKKYEVAVVFTNELIYSILESSIARYPLHLQRAAY